MYEVMIRSPEVSMMVLKAGKLLDNEGNIREEMAAAQNLVIQNTCCKRAFLRGIFLAGGSISDPEKSYHLEIVTQSFKKAGQLCEIIKAFEIDARIVKRKRSYVVYLKDSSQIVDFLNVCEAHVALMELENVRIMKEMRNSINRQVNCEAANIGKTIRASVRQMDDICLIRDKRGLESLPENLIEIAQLRLAYPDASLKELGDRANPPIGKSGVNHRLRRLSEIAEQIRDSQ
jgi:DNA-binding protein WhiA